MAAAFGVSASFLVIVIGSVSDASPIPGATSPIEANSPTWSGYILQGNTTNPISTEFIAPSITCTTPNDRVMLWAGYGGYVGTPDALVQAGLDVYCNAVGGGIGYSLFWELYVPGTHTTEQLVKATVRSGDMVDVSISHTSNSASFSFSVSGRGRHETIPPITASTNSLVPRARYSSSECIAESPRSSNGSFDHLPNFTAKFLACSPIADAIGEGQLTQLQLSNPRVANFANPSPPQSPGGQFFVYRQ